MSPLIITEGSDYINNLKPCGEKLSRRCLIMGRFSSILNELLMVPTADLSSIYVKLFTKSTSFLSRERKLDFL